MNTRNPRRIITRGVIDMATSAVLESDSYLYTGPMALCDAASVKAAVETALDTHFKKVNEVMDKHTSDIKTFGSVQEGTKAAIEELNTKGAQLQKDFNDAKTRNDALVLELQQKLAARGGGTGNDLRKSTGQLFIESQELKDFAPVGKMKGVHRSQPFKVKTITSAAASGGAGIAPEYIPTPVIPNFQNLTVRDLLSQGTTESDLIYWFQELLFTNNAAVVAETTLKPQSDITYDRKNIPVVTIAHWMKASKQVLADFKLLQTMIDTRLNFGLKLAEERELLYGDGTGEHLLGLVPQATPYAGLGAKPTDTHIDVIAHAMLQVRKAFYPASGIVMSVDDWFAIMLQKDSQLRYLWASPSGMLPAMLWGLPVVASDSFAVGDFMVGSFKLGATLLDREESQILLSTEDQDNFVRNMVTILCEERLALAVTRPASFVYGAFPAGT